MDNTKGDDLKEALTDQFHSITALERMLPKRNAEGENGLKRIFNNLQDVGNIPSLWRLRQRYLALGYWPPLTGQLVL